MFNFWKRESKDEGISCVIRNLNEGEWVCLSILSILDFADEIIFVDNASDDGSLDAVRRLKEDRGIEKLKIYTYPAIDGVKNKIHELYEFAFSKATKTWVFKWDGDFVARTDQRYSIMELKELWAWNRRKVDVFNICGLNLFGDHRHYLDSPPYDCDFCYEAYLWRNKGYRYVHGQKHELRVSDKPERSISIGPRAQADDRRVYFFHLQALKSDERITWRKTMSLWLQYCKDTKPPLLNYEQWLTQFWGTPSQAEQIKRCWAEFMPHLRRHDKVGGDWGDYPVLLKPYLENPRYEVLSRDGKPSERVTHGDREPVLPQVSLE